MNKFRRTVLFLCSIFLFTASLTVHAEETDYESETAEVQSENVQTEAEDKSASGLGYELYLYSSGWTGQTQAGNKSPSGRIEAIRIQLSGISGAVIYQTCVQNIGWMSEVKNGAVSGTTTHGLRVEAIRIRLSGEAEEKYDIWYRTNIAGYGQSGWVKNGSPCGSEGYERALEGIEIRLLEKGSTDLSSGIGFISNQSVSVYAYVQNDGWHNSVKSGDIAGTIGESLRLEGVKIVLDEELQALGDIQAQAYIQNTGWLDAVSSDQLIGTAGQSKRLEAIRISLSGELADLYDIYYKVHVSKIGWLGYAKNGESAGTMGYSLPIEAIRIYLEPKGFRSFDTSLPALYEYQKISYQAHSSNIGWADAVEAGKTAGTTGKNMEALIVTLPAGYAALGNISVEAHVQNKGWMAAVGSGQTAGTTGQSLRMEGIKISLTGTLGEICDVYYRTYVQGSGWLGWTKNGELAGSEGCSRAIQAIQIDIVHKNAKTYTLSTAYTTVSWSDFTDVNSILICANKKHKLPSGYEPSDLTVPNVPMNYSGTTMRKEAAQALENMFAGAKAAGITLILGSGYRSEAYQRTLYNGYVAMYGVEVADTISSRPGYSDHQTGLAADISDHDGATYLTQSMENTAEGKWLKVHAHEYGFIMRYPKGKQAVTGYSYEPWHFRYVGVETATAIYNVNVWYTFEEYFGIEGGDYAD